MCALISCLLTIFTSGELTPSSYEKINRSLTEHHIIPRYQKLADDIASIESISPILL